MSATAIRHADLSDHELVERAQQELPEAGEAFAALVRRHGAFVRARARRMLGSRTDAEDAAQDVFVSLLHNLTTYRPKGSFRNWLSVVTRNVCAMMLRARAREQERLETLALAIDRTGPAAPADPILGRVLRELLEELPARTRAALRLRLVEGLPFKTVARRLGISESAAKMRVQRGCESLRERYEALEDAAALASSGEIAEAA